ncbi:MAG: glycosyltransferase, partial [Bacteroidota bacterium]
MDTFLSPPDPAAGVGAVVVVPTYNESASIAAILQRVLELPGELAILVVDDGSPDGTADIVKQHQLEHPTRVGLVERAGKLGLGTAYLEGFRHALTAGFHYVCEMDADFSHNPDDLVHLVETRLVLEVCELSGQPRAPRGQAADRFLATGVDADRIGFGPERVELLRRGADDVAVEAAAVAAVGGQHDELRVLRLFAGLEQRVAHLQPGLHQVGHQPGHAVGVGGRRAGAVHRLLE